LECVPGIHESPKEVALDGVVLRHGTIEVSPAMVHGGPFPATTDGRSSSVGTIAMERFLRPVCYQSFPDALLPLALRTR
jgi:hypothetical protein